MSGEDNKIQSILKEMTELPSLIPQIHVEAMQRSLFDPINLNIDPRLFDGYGEVEERKCPALKSPMELPMPAFHYFKELLKLDEAKNQLAQERAELAQERAELAVEREALHHLKSQLFELNLKFYHKGFEGGKKLVIYLHELENSRGRDREKMEKMSLIHEKERLAMRNSQVLLKSAHTRERNRWDVKVPTHSSSANLTPTYAALSNDREIIEGFDEDGKKSSPLPSATNAEIAAAAVNQQPTSSLSRTSRVNDSNRHLLSSFLSESSSEEEEKEEFILVPERRPLADVGNQQLVKMINAPPVDPAKKRKSKKEKAQMQQWRTTGRIPNAIHKKLRYS